jgi:adapter protein MecA 1/2
MKIEKISDNQIRCTLNKSDLINRELRISELAYGSEKAKALFRDMIQQAFYEFGFEVDDIPLMIEAIPVSSECLILVITKVEDPDELDTRFSKFSSFDFKDDEDSSEPDEIYVEDVCNIEQLDEISDDIDENVSFKDTQELKPDEKQTLSIPSNPIRIFSFKTLNEVTELASVLAGQYYGANTLYKNPANSQYFLVISKTQHTPEEFGRICSIASEYGKSEKVTYASSTYFDEHYEIIVRDQALQILSVM